jgi:hypothetical protein
MGALMWSYLGWRRFPRELSGFELRRFFALEASDRRELRVRYPRRLRRGPLVFGAITYGSERVFCPGILRGSFVSR